MVELNPNILVRDAIIMAVGVSGTFPHAPMAQGWELRNEEGIKGGCVEREMICWER